MDRMDRKRFMAVLSDCLKKHRGAIAAFIITAAICYVIFLLYSMPMEPFYYSLVVVMVVGLFFFGASLIRNIKRAKERDQLKKGFVLGDELPSIHSLSEADYQEVVLALKKEIIEVQDEFERDRHRTDEYLTTWVHQIKTPIAVLKMMMAEEDTDEHRAISSELFRIEQYVDMALQYIRLECDDNDLLIREYSLDEMIRATIRKFAPQFIMKKLAINYEGTKKMIVTDRKWFTCILDQLVSNAIKYTPSGSISIYVREDASLCIEDTGIGIALEDIPRIFQKGYTGVNGRLEERASGLGLYLAQKTADKLNLNISVESVPGEGSRFVIRNGEKTS